VITADVPTASRITEASLASPYYSLVMELDPAVIAGLATDMAAVGDVDDAPVRIESTDSHVTDTALRLMRLLDRPAALPVLQPALVRELRGPAAAPVPCGTVRGCRRPPPVRRRRGPGK
jgi:hypothetical protein